MTINMTYYTPDELKFLSKSFQEVSLITFSRMRRGYATWNSPFAPRKNEDVFCPGMR
jgi:hypothetical protein